MPVLVCNACNVDFKDDSAQKAHYRSDWHRYNLKRKVAGVPGVTEALFNLRLETAAAEKKKQEGERLLYKCTLCGKEYSTKKAHLQHLQSKTHISKASNVEDASGAGVAVVRPAPVRPSREGSFTDKERERLEKERLEAEDDEDSDDSDWEEVDGDEAMDTITALRDSDNGAAGPSHDVIFDDWDATRCFICDHQGGSIEDCVEHMHKSHGFFIPDVEYLKDPSGLLTYLGLKVTKGHMCLFCDDRGKRFQSLEAVRKHMVDKSHCKLRFGEGDEAAEEELEEFYDYSSSYVESDGRQLMKVENADDAPVALASGGLELVVKGNGAGKKGSKTIGSRELFRYYRQRPRPSDQRDGIAVNAVIAKYRSMGVATQSPELRALRRVGPERAPSQRVEAFRSKVAMNHNVIWNLPKNTTH